MSFNAAERDRLLADPVAFMDSIACMVSQSCSKPDRFGQPDRLTFVSQPGQAYKVVGVGRDDLGLQRVPYYMLKKAGPRDAIWFNAYLIEYEDGKTPLTVLGDKATMCFTANMNGCTLGIGSQATPADALVVTHSNSRGHGSQAANTADQALKAGAAVGAGGELFQPENYRPHGQRQSITFGARSRGAKWQFYFLSYARKAGIIKTYGAKPVTTTTVTG
jgi:hypothetical protein